MFEIVPERPADLAPRDALLDLVFGADRAARTVYRLRDGLQSVPELSLVALEGGVFQGSLRFWPVRLSGATRPILLGPLAVDPARRGQAIGIALVRRGLHAAADLGHDAVLVVGDPPYYARFGFVPAPPHGLTLPGPVDPARFQVRELEAGVLVGLGGAVSRHDGSAPPGV